MLIVDAGQPEQLHAPLPELSNHAAEFEAVLFGLQHLIATGRTGSVSLYSDSKLVIDALNKQYAKHYADYVTKLLPLVEQFDLLLWQWLPDRQNRGAHALAQQGLRLAVKQAARKNGSPRG